MPKIIWDTSEAIDYKNSLDTAAQLLKNRGLDSEAIKYFIEPSYEDGLSDPFLIPNMLKAIKRIKTAIDKDQKIVIYGDYDIDGLSSSALMKQAFAMMGNDVSLYIPDRFEEGYGLNSKALKNLKDQGFDLVISVDCGTTAHDQLAQAKKIGLDVVVTDHHEPSGGEPAGAIACVNPKLESKNTLSDLAGVGVAFYLVRALQQKYKLINPGQEKWLLDMVALGTVCDIVPLIGDNRTLVIYGLKVLRKTRRQGLLALAEKSGIKINEINESDLGFKIGPRLNAAGRLAHAQKALDLLVTDSPEEADAVSLELNELNQKRQDDTKSIFEEANKQARKYKKDPVLVLSSEDWSHGVVGIVASRVSEKWNKPVILLQELGEYSKGSARSYGTFSIIDAIASCSEMLDTFGGHTFAAGLKIKSDRLDEFRYRINQYALTNMDVKNNFKVINISVNLDVAAPTLELYDNVAQLAPFGNSNKKPYMQGIYTLTELRLVGSDASHLRLKVKSEDGMEHIAIGFGMASDFENLKVGTKIKMAFELSDNVWQDRRTHQLQILDITKE